MKYFKPTKENNFQLRLIYLAYLSFKTDKEIRKFHRGKKKEKYLKQFMNTKPALQKILKNFLNRDNKADKDKKSDGMSTSNKMSN